MRFDLRKKLQEGETYSIKVSGGFMIFNAIYRFNGTKFIRILYNKNCDYSSLKKELNIIDFKIIVDKLDDDEFKFLGFFEK